MATPDDQRHLGLSARLWLGYFFAAVALIGSLTVALAAPFLLAGRWWPRSWTAGAWVLRQGVRVLLACQPWLRAEVRFAPEAEPVSGRGTLYVSNHRSTLDVFLLLAQIAGVRILAKRALAFVPFLGEAMWLTRQVFVPGRQPADFLAAMRRVEGGLRGGEPMHVFPEMTRCPPGFAGTRKFAVAPFQAALAANARVVPIVIRGTDGVWPKGFYGLAYRAPVEVRTLPPLEAAAFADPRQLMQAVRERIDRALEATR